MTTRRETARATLARLDSIEWLDDFELAVGSKVLGPELVATIEELRDELQAIHDDEIARCNECDLPATWREAHLGRPFLYWCEEHVEWVRKAESKGSYRGVLSRYPGNERVQRIRALLGIGEGRPERDPRFAQ